MAFSGGYVAIPLVGVVAATGGAIGAMLNPEGVPLIVTYHPAYLLRNLEDKARAWDDLCLAQQTLKAVDAP